MSILCARGNHRGVSIVYIDDLGRFVAYQAWGRQRSSTARSPSLQGSGGCDISIHATSSAPLPRAHRSTSPRARQSGGWRSTPGLDAALQPYDLRSAPPAQPPLFHRYGGWPYLLWYSCTINRKVGCMALKGRVSRYRDTSPHRVSRNQDMCPGGNG